MSEINRDSLYFIYIPNRSNDFKYSSIQNKYVITKISRVKFDDKEGNFDEDYYELSSDVFEFNKLVKKTKDKKEPEEYSYIIEYLFLTNSSMYVLIEILNLHNIKTMFYDKNPQHNLKFNTDRYQNVLENIFNYFIEINNNFTFEDASSVNAHKMLHLQKSINDYLHYFSFIQTFNVSSMNYFDRNISINIKYISLVNTFKLLEDNGYNNEFVTISSLQFMNGLNIYKPIPYKNYYNNNNISNEKLNFIVSKIFSKKKNDLKYTYKLQNNISQKEFKISNSRFYKIKTNYLFKIYIKKEILEKIINNFIHRNWITGFFNYDNLDTSIVNYRNFANYQYLIKNKYFDCDVKEIKKLNIKPFEYQYNNLKWMNYVEKLYETEHHYNYLGNLNFCYLKNINIPNTKIIYINRNSDQCKIKDLNSEEVYSDYDKTLKINGGILSDEVGLGKTLSSLLLILSRKKNDKLKKFDFNNLIITPNRLVEQWYIELQSYISKKLKIIKIITITDIKKQIFDISKSEYDIIIISSNLLTNDNYLKYINEDEYDLKGYRNFISKIKKDDLKEHHKYVKQNTKMLHKLENIDNESIRNSIKSELEKFKIDKNKKFNIFKIKWNRIFVDEAHEIIKSKFDKSSLNLFESSVGCIKEESTSKKNEEFKFFQLMKLKSNTKWCLTATPFKEKNKNMIGYMIFLNSKFSIEYDTEYKEKEYMNYFKKYTNVIFSLKEEQIESIFSIYFRQNKKKDLKSQIRIPIFTEEITYLTQNNIERNIYIEASRRNNISKLLQLCTHLVVSDDNINLDNFKFSLMNLDDIRNMNLIKYEKQLVKCKNDIEITKKTIEEEYIEFEKIKILVELLKTKSFNNIHYSNKDRINNFLRHIRRQTRYFRREEYEQNIALLKYIKDMIFNDDFITNFTTNYNEVCLTIYNIDINSYIITNEEKLYFIFRLYQLKYESIKNIIKTNEDNIEKYKREIYRLENQIKLFSNTDFVTECVNDPCSICFEPYEEETKIAITICRHIMCSNCIETLFRNKTNINCPFCRKLLYKNDINFTLCNLVNKKEEKKEEEKKLEEDDNVKKYGTKLAYLIDYITDLFKNEDNRIIIFSQYDRMLKLIGKVLDDFHIKNLFVKGNIMSVSKNIQKFKTDKSYKIIMLSSERSSSGNNLTEASHIIFVDSINGDKKLVKDLESQAIGRAVRLGQKKPVKVKRLLMKNTIEEEFYNKNKYDMEELQ